MDVMDGQPPLRRKPTWGTGVRGFPTLTVVSFTPKVEGSLLPQVCDNLQVKEVKLDAAPDRRWVICHNPAEADRDKTQRDTALDRIRAELERIKTLRDRATKTASKKAGKTSGHAGRQSSPG